MAVRILKEDRPAAFIIAEANGRLSREQIVLGITAVAVPSGTVLGKVTATGAYVPLAPAAGDGSQNAAAILFERREISAATQRAVGFVRNGEVNGRKLVYLNTVTGGQQAAAEAALAANGVLVRY